MNYKEITENLCYKDTRNPNGVISYLDADEIEKEGYGNHKGDDCSCDNCFYGRTELAEELLKIKCNPCIEGNKFVLRTSDNLFDEIRKIWDAAEIYVLHDVGEIVKGDADYEANPIDLREYFDKYYS